MSKDTMNVTPVQMFGLPVVGAYTRYDLYAPLKFEEEKCISPDLIMGIEIEIEDARRMHPIGPITVENDNSLRNNGLEFITLPLFHKHALAVLKNFYQQNKVTEENYSERCSTHVHVNAGNLTLEQIGDLCLLYQVVEDLLFKFVGRYRSDNIFCVPWNEAGVSYMLVNNLRDKGTGHSVIAGWQKYTALNLLPLASKGSVEFRHMYGTCDTEKISQWLNLIGCMFEYIKQVPLEELKKLILNMNTISNYEGWLEQVFQQYTSLLRCPDYQVLLSNGVIEAKCMLHTPPKAEAKAYKKKLGEDHFIEDDIIDALHLAAPVVQNQRARRGGQIGGLNFDQAVAPPPRRVDWEALRQDIVANWGPNHAVAEVPVGAQNLQNLLNANPNQGNQ